MDVAEIYQEAPRLLLTLVASVIGFRFFHTRKLVSFSSVFHFRSTASYESACKCLLVLCLKSLGLRLVIKPP